VADLEQMLLVVLTLVLVVQAVVQVVVCQHLIQLMMVD
jgi:hypothetical protein